MSEKIVQLNEEVIKGQIKGQIKEGVRGSGEETLKTSPAGSVSSNGFVGAVWTV